ncbi:MAG TPA: DUF4382 domain-containing protein [Candidatus Saccharimonadales bacterium]|nr:DUF4382 domain-containing protein [Candidatus Saccharimonadales bacterium]
MATSKTQKGGYINSRLFLGVLIIGIVFAVVMVSQKTSWFNNAAGPQQLPANAITNLNSASEIVETNNPDGTMGPATWYGNASNALPSDLKGNLLFKVIDPPQKDKPEKPGNQGNRPTDSTPINPTETPSTPIQSGASPSPSATRKNGPQNVSALNLTITKVEVHMSYQGDPKDNKDLKSSSSAKVKPSISPSPVGGKNVDHWETLNITTPFTVDLVNLAKTKDFAQLGLTQLAAGRYTEVRLYVSSATAAFAEGTIVPLTILGRDNVVKINRSFTISAGQTTTLTMDLDANHSVIKAGGQYLLKPVASRLIEEKQ